MKRISVFLLPFFLGTFIGLNVLAQSASAQWAPIQSRDYAPLPSGPYLAENDDSEMITVPVTVEYTAVYPDGRTEVIRTAGKTEVRLSTNQVLVGLTFLAYFSYINTLTLGGGPFTATNVVLTLTFPLALVALSVVGNSFFSCENTGSQVQCTASSFPANASEEMAVEMQAQAAGTHTITSGMTQNEFDPDPSDNTDSQQITVLPGKTISGTVVNDDNGNGITEDGDNPVTGVCLFIDENNDGVQDDGEPTATTDSDGNYSFTVAEDGDYDILRCTSPSSSYLTAHPVSELRQVTVAGESVTGVNWFLSLPITVYMGKYEDMNGNGSRDSGDDPIAEWRGLLAGETRIFSTNQTLSSSWQTGSNGVAELNNLLPNRLSLSETGQEGWSQSDPGTEEGTVTLDIRSGQSYSPWFGNFRVPGLISAKLINDFNEDGVLDGSDGRISGVKFWIDIDKDGQEDVGEPSATTDTDGVAALQPTTPGEVAICTADTDAVGPVSPSWSSGSWCQDVSLQSGDPEQEVTFFGTVLGFLITGTLIEDNDGDGVTDDGEVGASGVCLFGDGDNDGVQDDGETTFTTDANGAFVYGPVLAGDYTLRLCEQSSWFTVAPEDGHLTVTIEASNFEASDWYVVVPSSLSVRTWHDRNANGTRDEGDEGLSGWRTLVTGANPLFALATNTSVTGALDTDEFGYASFTNLRPNNLAFSWGPRTGWSQSYPANNEAYQYSVVSGVDLTVDGFGLWKQPGNIIVEFVNDQNENGQKDPNEGTLFGYPFYLDLNSNGQLDEGEPTNTTDQDGFAVLTPTYPGTYPVCTSTTTVNPVFPANDDGGAWCTDVTTVSDGSVQTFTFFGTAPPVIVEGYKWIDVDGDGQEGDGEPRLNGVTINLLSGGTVIASAETADLDRNGDGSIDATTERGWYQFVISADGEYAIEEVVPEGMEQTSPSSGSHQITITGLQSPAIFYPFANFIPALDWGDLPNPREDLEEECPRGAPINCYRTLAGVQGAAHMISATSVRLGQRIDAETNGQPNSDATGDDDNISSQGAEDDEDGLLDFVVDGTGKITLVLDISGNGFLDAYADINDDGVLNDGVLGGSPIEAFFVAQPVVNGTNILETPEGIVEPFADIKFIRLRVSSTGGLGAAGIALDGEVEDYRVSVRRTQVINSSDDTNDANPGDGICADANGNCSLRAAIEEANASGQPHRLDFSSAGKSAVTVQPTTPLPAFLVPVWIQSGGELEIDGSLAGADAHGLTAASDGSFISGVTIHSFSGDGVRIESGSNNVVSSSVIHGNGGNGVTVAAGSGNRVSETVLYGNGGLGIDLGNDGVTANDNGDADTGPNGLRNAPVFSLITAENGYMEGTVYTELLETVTIDLFSSSTCDPSGSGQGEVFLTSIEVNGLSAGDAAFTASVPPLAIGDVITATATGADGSTSEFSSCFVAVTTHIEREESGELPQQFTLDQNYPNPFNPVTTIQFSVSQTEHVRIEVFDMLGKRVAGLVDRTMEPGSYSISFDAQDLPSGQYIYTMQAGSFQQTRTLTLLK